MTKDFKIKARRIFERRNTMKLDAFTKQIENICAALSRSDYQKRESHLLHVVDYWKRRATR